MAGDKYAALRAEFVGGMMTVADLARAHGLPEKPMQNAAQRQGWQALRDERVKNEETARKSEELAAIKEESRNAAQERVQAREDANKRHRELALNLQGEIVRAIKAARNAQEPQSAGAIRQLAGALESMQRVERLALGMTTEIQEMQADVRHAEAFLTDEDLRRELQERGLPAQLFDHADAPPP